MTMRQKTKKIMRHALLIGAASVFNFACIGGSVALDAGNPVSGTNASQNHSMHKSSAKRPELGMSAAVDAQGKLWVVAKENTEAGDYVALRNSSDGGKSWSALSRINSQPEPIAADGENHPKLVFGAKGQFYVTWTKPTSKNYTGDIRFTRSIDGGRSWSPVVNVHKDEQLITHRFESLKVDRAGRLYVMWIDKRDAQKAREKNEKYDGAALYYAVSDNGGLNWRGDFKIADHSCECCRIALAADRDGAPIAFWRHVFAGSERDHAIVKLTPDGELNTIRRATFDAWKIDACPHQGPSLAIADKVLHAVWFSATNGEGRIFYGRLKDDVVDGQRAIPDTRAEHAAIAADGERVWIVWKNFDGEKSNIGMTASSDGGKTWSENTLVSTAGSADHPRLVLYAGRALLVWNTENEGIVIRSLS